MEDVEIMKAKRNSETKKTSRNTDIEFFRLWYSILIVCFHVFASSGFMIGGNIGVEYFLVISGYLLFYSYLKSETSTTIMKPTEWFLKRFKRLFPWMLTSFLLAVVIVRVILPHDDTSTFLEYLLSDFWEVLMLNMNGLNTSHYALNEPTWNMSALLIAGFCLWVFLYLFRNKFTDAILPLILLIISGMYLQYFNKSPEQWAVFSTSGTIRAFMVMGASYYSVLLAKRLSDFPLSKAGALLLTIAELLCHAIVLYIALANGSTKGRLFSTVFLLLATAIAFSGHSYWASFAGKYRIFELGGEISISIYLVHRPLLKLYNYVNGDIMNRQDFTYYLLFTLAIAMIYHVVTLALIKGWDKAWIYIKRKLSET